MRISAFADEISDLVSQSYDRDHTVREYVKLCEENLYDLEEKTVDQFVPPKSSVLVVGCGAGREAHALAKKGYRVTGVDVSGKMLCQARELAALQNLKIDFQYGDMQNLPKSLGKFDAIFFSDSIICHIPFRKKRVEVFQKAAQLLKPEGVLIALIWWVAPQRHFFYHSRLWTFVRWLKRRIIDYPLKEVGDAFFKDKQGNKTGYFYYYQLSDEIRSELNATGLNLIHQNHTAWVLKK